MGDRLKSRCAGLLEIRGVHKESGSMGTVQYMHRTVRDFFMIPRTWSFVLAATAQSNFRPQYSVLKSILLHHRLVSTRYLGPSLFATAKQVLKAAQEVCSDVEDPNDSCELLLNTLNNTLNAEYHGKGFLNSDPPHWSGLVDIEHPRQWPDSFTSAAVQYGLLSYVENQLDRRKEALLKKNGRPLLDIALSIHSCAISVPLPTRRDIATLLLKAGADPNQLVGSFTVWQNFLLSATASVFPNEDLMMFLEIQEELVAHGASFVGVVFTVAEQYRWCRNIRSLWHKLAPERTERLMISIQVDNSVAPQVSLETPLNSPLSPPATPLTPPTPTATEIGLTHATISRQNETCGKINDENPKVKQGRSFTQKIREWRKSKT